jgi:pimeloyl-ACP methyl ester carboxylesterase
LFFFSSSQAVDSDSFDIVQQAVARDYNLLRIALGGKSAKLNFIGVSYGKQRTGLFLILSRSFLTLVFLLGTILAAQYVHYFPETVRAFILDSVMPQTPVTAENNDYFMTKYEAIGKDRELRRLGEWCDKNSECALHSLGPGGFFKVRFLSNRTHRVNLTHFFFPFLLQTLNKVLLTAREKPYPIPGCDGGKWCLATLDEDELLNRFNDFLPEQEYWDEFAEGLKQMVDHGNATQFSVRYLLTETGQSISQR